MYSRFVRWRRAGVSNLIINALAAANDTAVQMTDICFVFVHEHSGCVCRSKRQYMVRARDGLISEIHALMSIDSFLIRLALGSSSAHGNRYIGKLISSREFRSIPPPDHGYDVNSIKELALKKDV